MSYRDSEFYRVPMLLADGGNWVTVRDRLRWAADARGLLGHLDGSVSKPIDPSVGAATSAVGQAARTSGAGKGATGSPSTTDVEMREYEAALTRWRTNEAMLKQAIANSVPDSVFNRIKSKTSAKEVWDTLTATFEGRSLMVAIDLRKRMQDIKCGDNDNLRDHYETLANMNELLSSYGVTITDSEYANILMASLPSGYDPAISSLSAAAKLAKIEVNSDTVISITLDDYDRRVALNRPDAPDPTDQSYTAATNGKTGNDYKCDNCGKSGHTKEYCWAKGGGREGQGPSGTAETNVESEANCAFADDDIW